MTANSAPRYKTMKPIHLFLCCILFGTAGYAQEAETPPQVSFTQTITGNTYAVRSEWYVTTIANTANHLDDALYYLDGSPVAFEDQEQSLAQVIPEGLKRAMMATFTASEYAALKSIREALLISCIISNTGDVLELTYLIGTADYAKIPLAKFALLESNLKKYLKFRVTDFGKKLKYLSGCIAYNFYHYDLPYNEPESDQTGQQTGHDPTVGNDGRPTLNVNS